MKRREILGLGVCALLVPNALRAQKAAAPTVGVLLGGAPESHAALYDAFRRGMREAGWREGENVRLEVRWARGKNDAMLPLADELVGLVPAVIVTASTPALVAAVKAAQGRIHIVMASGDDPVLLGFAKSYSRPGGNVTGTSNLLRDLGAKQIELMRLVKPKVQRVGVLINPSNATSVGLYKANEVAYRKAGLIPNLAEASSTEGLAQAFERFAREGAEAVIIQADAFFLTQRALIARVAIERKLPTMHAFRELVESGGLMSYGVSLPYSYHRAAYFVDRILRGAKPADLPIEQPTTVELTINLKTAKALGVRVPNELLLRADRVIE
jgi:putative ABC transport system substrate-binding protein